MEEYLKEEAIEECQKWYAAIQHYFATCNLYWLFLTRLEEFDYRLFRFTHHSTFLRLTRASHFEMLLIRFYSLVSAKDRKVKKGSTEEISLTLPNFFKFLKKNAKNENLREKFTSRVEEEIFLSWVEKITERLSVLRNKFTAHLDTEYLFKDKNIDFKPLGSEELRLMLDEAESYFNMMTFNVYRNLWFWDYGENARERKELDIDRILEFIAMNSSIIERSQDHPEIWEMHRRDLTDVQIAKINEIRRKMGLPDVE